MTQNLEQRVHEELGFYPSYLAAIEEHEVCADLVWEETRRVLTEEWSRQRGQFTAGRAAAVIEEHISESTMRTIDRSTFGSTALNQSVVFFSFVMFRLGLGISACRYGVDDDGLRQKHRSVAGPTETAELPVCVQNGVDQSLPLSPGLDLVEPAAASEEVETTYNRVLHTLETPNVNNVFRGFAVDPQFLSAVVDTQIKIVETAGETTELSAHLQGVYAQALEGRTLPLTRERLLQATENNVAAVDAVTETLRVYHDNLTTLILTLYLGALLVSQ
jgi:hypothetical protein